MGEGSDLAGCVVGPGAELAPGSRVRRRLVARRTAGGSLPAGSSVVGNVVYAPLDPLQPSEERPPSGATG